MKMKVWEDMDPKFILFDENNLEPKRLLSIKTA